VIVVDRPRRLVGCEVPAGLVLAHLQDQDEAERGPEAAKGRELVGVELCHAAMMPASGRERPPEWQRAPAAGVGMAGSR
jgi:hypothetical protein